MAKNGKKRPLVHSHDATRPDSGSTMSEPNVTPMIDVLLVLLIIFMIVTPVAQKGLDIALPQASQQQPEQQQQSSNQVVLSIEPSPAGPVMSVNKSAVAGFGELETRLRDIFNTRSDKTMFVRASGEITYGRVVKAMDIARGAGVERIGIISEKMIEEAGGMIGDEEGEAPVEGP